MSIPNSWQEIFLLFGATQGIILTIALITRAKLKTQANQILIWFILSLVFLLLSGISFDNPILQYVKVGMGYFGDTATFLYGPLIYLYTRKLLLVENRYNEWFHFLPAITFFLINIAVNIIGSENLSVPFYVYYFGIVSVFVFCQLYVYLFLAIKVILLYKDGVSEEFSYRPSVNYLLTIIGFVIFTLSLFLINFTFETFHLNSILASFNYNFAWACISSVTFLLAYYAIIKPDLFRISNFKLMSNSINTDEIEKLKELLLLQMIQNKLYLDPDLSLSMLASIIKTRKEIVSKVLNQGMSKNFYRFVNEYRIEEFMRLVSLEETKNITYLGIASDAGFKSKTTFYKAFKDIYGTTPTEYLKSH